MTRRRVHHYTSRFVLAAALGLSLSVGARSALAQNALAPVENLACVCAFDPEGEAFGLDVTWTVAAAAVYEGFRIFVDGDEVGVVTGNQRAFRLDLPSAAVGPHLVTVLGFLGGEESPPANCQSECRLDEEIVPAVTDLQCDCAQDSTTGSFRLGAAWGVPEKAAYDFIRILLDGAELFRLGGEEQQFELEGGEELSGPHQLTILGSRGGVDGAPVSCSPECEVSLAAPVDPACSCDYDPENDAFLFKAGWTLPEGAVYDAVRVLVDGMEVAVVAGDAQEAEAVLPNDGTAEGPKAVTIIGLLDAEESPPAECETVCELPPLEPVTELSCGCGFDFEDQVFVIDVAWENPENSGFEAIDVLFDDVAPIVLASEDTQLEIRLAVDQAGTHEVSVLGRRGAEAGAPAVCVVTCEPASLPVATIEADAEKVLLPLEGFAEVLLDGRASIDAQQGTALRYYWDLPQGEGGGAEILQPKQSVTRVRFSAPGLFTVRLTVFCCGKFLAAASVTQTVEVVGAATPAIDHAPLVLAPVRAALMTVAGRPFERALTLLEGAPFPSFELLKAPRGLQFNARTQVISWLPGLSDASLSHPVSLRVSNEVSDVLVEFEIIVIDPGVSVGLYDFTPAGGPDVPPGDGPVLAEAPTVILDRGLLEPPLDLVLQLGDAPECSVQVVLPDPALQDPRPAGDRHGFPALRFDPTCAGVLPRAGAAVLPPEGDGGGAGVAPSSGGFYTSGSSATSFFEAVDNDFSVELWLSDAPLDQPGADPDVAAFVFAMGSTDATEDFNWLVSLGDNGAYTASVQTTDPTPVSLTTTADFSDSTAHQLVLVRAGNTHRFYVDGALAAESIGAEVDLDWDGGYSFLLGNDGLQTRPFAGDILLASAYPGALSSTLIDFLFDLGPIVPGAGDVPAPIADICPDPRELERGTVYADGSLSTAGVGVGGGAGGGAGVAEPTCSDLLRPFRWEVFPSEGRDDLNLEPMDGEEECSRRVLVGYDPAAGGAFDLEVRLTVTQVPVRGVVRTGTHTKTLQLPTPAFRRGVIDGDLTLDVSDPVRLLFFLFAGGPAPTCMDAADSNDDGEVDITDGFHLLNYLFLAAPPPAAPFLTCGLDPTQDDSLDCEVGVCP